MSRGEMSYTRRKDRISCPSSCRYQKFRADLSRCAPAERCDWLTFRQTILSALVFCQYSLCTAVIRDTLNNGRTSNIIQRIFTLYVIRYMYSHGEQPSERKSLCICVWQIFPRRLSHLCSKNISICVVNNSDNSELSDTYMPLACNA